MSGELARESWSGGAGVAWGRWGRGGVGGGECLGKEGRPAPDRTHFWKGMILLEQADPPLTGVTTTEGSASCS